MLEKERHQEQHRRTQEALTQETALETGNCGEQSAKTTASKNQEDVEPNNGEEPNQQNSPAKPTPRKSETKNMHRAT
jgi:hypothetical protein